MALTESLRYKRYDPTTATTTFLVTFPIWDDDEVEVLVDGVGVTAFSVTASFASGTGRADNASVVLVTAVSGVPVEIYGNRAARADGGYSGNASRLTEVVGNDFDRLAAVQQEIRRDLRRALKYPMSRVGNEAATLDPVDNALLVFDSDGNVVAGPDATNLIETSTFSPGFIFTGTGDGTTTTYELNFTPSSDENIFVFIGGVQQVSGLDFTVAGSVLTFTSPWPVGESIVIRAPIVDLDNPETYLALLAGQTRFMSEFGAVGGAIVVNGLLASGADDTVAMQAAFDWAGARRGRKIMGDPGATYRISDTIAGEGHVNVDWNGARVHFTANVQGFEFVAPGSTYSLTSNYAPGSLTISTNTVAALRPGQWVKIVSNAADPANRDQGSSANQFRIGEWFQVAQGTTSTVVQMTAPLRFSRAISPTSTSGSEAIIDAYTTTMNARIVVPEEKDFQWLDCFISYEDGNEATWTGEGLAVYGYARPFISGHKTGRGYGAGIVLAGTQQARVTSGRSVYLEDNTPNSQFGYGISVGGSVMTNVDNHLFQDTRHGFTTSNTATAADTTDIKRLYRMGRTVGGTISDCQAFGFQSVAPFDTHHDAEDLVFQNCQAHNCASGGFAVRGRNITLDNPKVRNCNGGITVFSDFNGSLTDGDTWVNGRTREDFTSCTIINPDIHVVGNHVAGTCEPVITTRLATTDIIFGPACRSVSHQFLKLRGPTRIAGHVLFEVADANGATPLIDVDAAAAILAESAGTDVNGDDLSVLVGDRVVIEANSDLRLECGATGATGFLGVKTTGSTAAVAVRGRLFIETPTTIDQLLSGNNIGTEDMGQVRYAVFGAADDSVSLGTTGRQVRLLSDDGLVNIGAFQQGPYSTQTAAGAAIIPADQRVIEALYDSGASVRRFRRISSGGVFQSADGQHWFPVLIPGPYANDTAAASAGISIGEIYRVTGGTLAWRVS